MKLNLINITKLYYLTLLITSTLVLEKALEVLSSRSLGFVTLQVVSGVIGPVSTIFWPWLVFLTYVGVCLVECFRIYSSSEYEIFFPYPIMALIIFKEFSHILEGVLFSTVLGISVFLYLRDHSHRFYLPLIRPHHYIISVLTISLLLLWNNIWVQYRAFENLTYGHSDLSWHYLRLKETALGNAWLSHDFFPLFSDHFNAGLILLVPFYWCLQSLEVMIWLQAISLSAAVLAIGWYCWHKSRSLALTSSVILIAMFQPSLTQLSYSFSYGYHLSVTALPLMIVSVIFWEKRKYVLFSLTALLVISLKEVHAVFFIGMGLVRALYPEPGKVRGHGLILASLAAASLYYLIEVFLPQFSPTETYERSRLFSQFGSTIPDMIVGLPSHFKLICAKIFRPEVVVFFVMLLGGMSFLPLLKPAYIGYGLPALMGIALMQRDNMVNIAFWYQVDIFAAVLLAFVAALSRFWSIWSKQRLMQLLAASLVTSVSMSWFYGLTPFSKNTLPARMIYGHKISSPEVISTNQEIHLLRTKLDKSLKILSSCRAYTVLLDHPKAVPLDYIGDRKLADFDFVVIDFNDIGWSINYHQLRQWHNKLLSTHQFDVFRHDKLFYYLNCNRKVKFMELIDQKSGWTCYARSNW